MPMHSMLIILFVFRLTYCLPHNEQDESISHQICLDFLQVVKECHLELLQKLKTHLLVHLVESMPAYGPTAVFNTERL